MKPVIKNLALALTCCTIVFAACQKNGVNNEDPELAETLMVTEDDAEADMIFADVYEQSAGINGDFGIGQTDLFLTADNDGGTTIELADPVTTPCIKITVTPQEPNAFPKTVTIDYGTGCVGRDGRTRSGKVVTVYSKPLIMPGSQAVTEFNNYFVNGVKVEGRHVVRNNSTSNVLVMTRIVQNGKLTRPNGNYITWNAEHTNTQIEGLGTPLFHRDDEYLISGGARGETKRGDVSNTWSRRIIEPLHKVFTCRWFDKGKVTITRNDKTATLDYGNGTCDNKATISAGGQSKEITLR